jgi:hypothetical protein
MVCNGQHECGQLGVGIVNRITVRTATCLLCSPGPVEPGLQLQLTSIGELVSCTTDILDNPTTQDYQDGETAVFSSTQGIGACGVSRWQWLGWTTGLFR